MASMYARNNYHSSALLAARLENYIKKLGFLGSFKSKIPKRPHFRSFVQLYTYHI